MRIKIGIIGFFAKGLEKAGGQEVKTCTLGQLLEEHYGKEQVLRLDTTNSKNILYAIRLCVCCLKLVKRCNNVIILPAQKGIRVFAPLLVGANLLYHRKLHYVVIGGWLPLFLRKRKVLAYIIKKFDGVYVETKSMKRELENMGFENIYIMPNFKKLGILEEEELIYSINEPYRICTFSRVLKEKGIEDVVEAVKRTNTALGRRVFLLDIYGQIESTQTIWFKKLEDSFPEYIQYRGVVCPKSSVSVLKNYFALVFPTRFYTEGIPGTIIDAYASGIPVIASEWENFSDIVDSECTGIGYSFGEIDSLSDVLLRIAIEPSIIHSMKKNCLVKAQEYLPRKAARILIKELR